LQARPLLENEEGVAIILYGDAPLVRASSIREMIRMLGEHGAAGAMLTAKFDNPYGYGRIVRAADGTVERIVEQKDCGPKENEIQEINAGTYCFDIRKLFAALSEVKNDNAQNEYYLTDVIAILRAKGEKVIAYCTDDPAESLGINDRIQLAEAERAMRERINRDHMRNGVTMIDPDRTYIDKDVRIGADTVLYPGTVLRGKTVIGEQCAIGPDTEIADSVISDHVKIRHSVLTEAEVGSGVTIGPFAHLRPGSRLASGVKIGNFVEIKNATLGEEAKASHLSYIGDAQVGSNVNIGCGAITVNYDGYNKHRTIIEDDAFVGSNVNLIAPVRVGKGAYVVAGSTITRDVADNDMAIARERQTNKPGYAVKLRERFKTIKQNRDP
jgi:bifunctional UDP-N-acetylglucosamine pyrophosphorylase/glucosamine-1-phosphate N-acetyltransferase